MRWRAAGRVAVLAFGLWLAGPSGSARAAVEGVTGTWAIVVEPGPAKAKTRPATLKLKQDGGKLAGTVTLPSGNETEIQDGKVAGDRLSFFIQPGPGLTKIHHSGTVNGDTITGKIEFEIQGKKRPGHDWEAKRVPD